MQFPRSTIVTVIVLIVVLLLVAWYAVSLKDRSEVSDIAASPAVQALSAEEPFTTIDGIPLVLSDYIGAGPVVVMSWASWCPDCGRELQNLAEVASQHQADGLTVIAINRSETVKTVKQYLRSIGEPQNIVFALDAADAFYQNIGGFNVPETVFYSENGELVVHQRGTMDRALLQQYLGTVLTNDN